MRIKYPRTYHLPWSLGQAADDKTLPSTAHFEGREVVVTEKLDGENTSIYSDGYTHARSIDSAHHPARAWVKQLAARIMAEGLSDTMRLCGENMFARHSIGYDRLVSYFYMFSVWDGNLCLSWDATEEWAALLDVDLVPVLYRGVWDPDAIKAAWSGRSALGDEGEGYVVRVADAFPYEKFGTSVAKFVRANHVQTDNHWMHSQVVANKLIGEK